MKFVILSKASRLDILLSLLTQYDSAQSKKKGHNPYALGHYFNAAHAWNNNPLSKTNALAALAKAFIPLPNDPTDFYLAPVRHFAKLLKEGKI